MDDGVLDGTRINSRPSANTYSEYGKLEPEPPPSEGSKIKSKDKWGRGEGQTKTSTNELTAALSRSPYSRRH